MSGGVGPCKDIGVIEDEKEIQEQRQETTQPKTSTSRHHRFLSFRQLNALAIIIVLSSSGMVAPEDFVFVVFSVIYVLFLSKLVFPPITPSHDPPLLGEKNLTLNLYVFLGVVIGLFAPIAYIFEGVVEGDKEGIKAATPHVFLLACQIFLEGVIFSGEFSLPIRAFVPVLYNGKRFVALMDWLLREIVMDEEGHGSRRRVHVGRWLAVVNLAFWSFNLFGFLVPVYLPRAFKKYYGCKEKP